MTANTYKDGTSVNKSSGLNLTPENGQAIAAAINKGRRNTNPPAADMQKVEWDSELASDLKKFSDQVGPAWFFMSDRISGGRNGMNIFKLQQFKKYADYTFLLHDSTRTSLSQGIKGIIDFRFAQKPCFDYNNCSATEFRGYQSCYPNKLPKRNCNWVMDYYPVMVQSDLNKVACVAQNFHGPNAPKFQDMTFWCYGRIKDRANEFPNNDVPYLKGTPCSKCPPEAPICDDGLCVPKLK